MVTSHSEFKKHAWENYFPVGHAKRSGRGEAKYEMLRLMGGGGSSSMIVGRVLVRGWSIDGVL